MYILLGSVFRVRLRVRARILAALLRAVLGGNAGKIVAYADAVMGYGYRRDNIDNGIFLWSKKLVATLG